MTGATSGDENEQRRIGRESTETREERQQAREAHRETLRRMDEEDARLAEIERLQQRSPDALALRTNENATEQQLPPGQEQQQGRGGRNDRGRSRSPSSVGGSKRRPSDHESRHRDRRTGSPFRGQYDNRLQGRRQHDTDRDRHRGGHHHRRRDYSDSSNDSGEEDLPSDDNDDRSRSRDRNHNRQSNHDRDRRGFDEGTREVNHLPPKKAMSYRKAPQKQQRHIVERIAILVKGTIFRKLKIITSEKMFQKAMKMVVDMECPDDEDDFIRIYKICVTGGINAKRSICEQAAMRIVHILLTRKGYTERNLDAPYSVDTLVKLRQSVTNEEKEAFQWFIGEFVGSVAGTKLWKRKKIYHRVSEAVIDKGGKELVVTVSDEAFAILIYENYIDKWIAKFHMERRGEKSTGNLKGKYTSPVNDEILYGGWSAEGVARFNALSKLVEDDRASPVAKDAEDEVLRALRREKFGDNVDNASVRDPQEERQGRRAMPAAIEAYCELD